MIRKKGKEDYLIRQWNQYQLMQIMNSKYEDDKLYGIRLKSINILERNRELKELSASMQVYT
jgi:hypothetical protein